jgi:GDP-mannose 4,6-dehydratase
MPTALITGITGQDGSYLAEFLLAKGYRVVGVVRRSSTTPYERIAHLVDRIELISADLLDQTSLMDAMEEVRPDEIYNLAAQSFVAASWTQPVLTGEFTAIGVTRMLEAMHRTAPKARFYQASSSEMFGLVQETPQKETTPYYPRSPYGVGVDVGSIEYIHGRIIEERDRGAAVLIVSSELDEVMALSDRVLVMYAGKIAAEFEGSGASTTEIGLAMLGSGSSNE